MNFSVTTNRPRVRFHNHSNNRQFVIMKFLVLIVMGLSVLGVVGSFLINANVVNDYANCTVTRTEVSVISNDGDVSSQKRVYTENCGVFTADDNLAHGVWNSADIYGSIKEGETYNFTASGIRFSSPFFSFFPNIITATQVAR